MVIAIHAFDILPFSHFLVLQSGSEIVVRYMKVKLPSVRYR